MQRAHNVRIHNAIATSAALGFPIALASTVGNLIGGRSLPPALPEAFGYLYLPALAVISGVSVLLAQVGARAAHALGVRQLKRVFALLLYVLVAYTELTKSSESIGRVAGYLTANGLRMHHSRSDDSSR